MTEIKFVGKTLLLTIVIVVILQIQMGDRTLESRAIQFVQSSQVVEPLNAAARGAVKAVRDLTATIKRKITGSSENPKNRGYSI